jgi:hypothetical protein
MTDTTSGQNAEAVIGFLFIAAFLWKPKVLIGAWVWFLVWLIGPPQ